MSNVPKPAAKTTTTPVPVPKVQPAAGIKPPEPPGPKAVSGPDSTSEPVDTKTGAGPAPKSPEDTKSGPADAKTGPAPKPSAPADAKDGSAAKPPADAKPGPALKPGAAAKKPVPAAKPKPKAAPKKVKKAKTTTTKKPAPSNDKFPKAFGYLAYPKVVISIGATQIGLGLFSAAVGFLLYFGNVLPPRPDLDLGEERAADYKLGYYRTCLGAGVSGMLIQLVGIITLLSGLNKKQSYADMSCLLQFFLCIVLLYYITYTVSTGLTSFVAGTLLYLFVWTPDVYFLLSLWSFAKILGDIELNDEETEVWPVSSEPGGLSDPKKPLHVQLGPEINIQRPSVAEDDDISHDDGEDDPHHRRHRKKKKSMAATVIEETVILNKKSGEVVHKSSKIIPATELDENHDLEKHGHKKKSHADADGFVRLKQHGHKSHSGISITPSEMSQAQDPSQASFDQEHKHKRKSHLDLPTAGPSHSSSEGSVGPSHPHHGRRSSHKVHPEPKPEPDHPPPS